MFFFSKSCFSVLLLVFLYLCGYCQNYQYYFGNIHSHSSYSDGNQDSTASFCTTPLQDFDYAKNALCFDFLGISDHNHAGAGMSLPNYTKGLGQADSANQDGSFVAMYGMEWGVISLGGHVIIYGYNQLIGWETNNYSIYNSATDYKGLFLKVARTSGAFAYLAHPSNADFDSIAYKPLNLTSDSAIVGVAIRSGPAFSIDTTYTNPSTTSYEAYYKKMLARGYHLGAGIDHDNHNTTFGRTTHGRLAILAPSLSRTNILNAIRDMRFYATDDCNAQLSFQINGNAMGSILENTDNPTLSISLTDFDLENVASIKIYYGIPGSGATPTILTSNTNQSSLTFTHNLNVNNQFYYYTKITQTDGDVIISSPIWYKKIPTPLPVEWVTFSCKNEIEKVELDWVINDLNHNNGFLIEKSNNGIDFKTICEVAFVADKAQYSFVDLQPFLGESYYRLIGIDINGDLQILGTLKTQVSTEAVKATIFPQPSRDILNIDLKGTITEDANYTLTIWEQLGQTVFSAPISPHNTFVLDLKKFHSGIYYYQLSSEGKRLDGGKIIVE